MRIRSSRQPKIIQGKEDLVLSSSGISVITNNPTISLGLSAPYQQQALDLNNMLHNEMTKQLYDHQLKIMGERAVLYMQAKDKALEEATRKCRAMEIHLSEVLDEVATWKTLSDQKTALCRDLASRLLKMRREMAKTTGRTFVEEEQAIVNWGKWRG
ncbi:unnamed protein product [Thlaspi arvense]|uniref:Uncharacterized protein n=1 Tax=Thlaspi arvense TaxID=13288 RepID=A0AAU9T0G9_THLAR|nr:unnamed protein product [Thlaspi arvense]